MGEPMSLAETRRATAELGRLGAQLALNLARRRADTLDALDPGTVAMLDATTQADIQAAFDEIDASLALPFEGSGGRR